ncbi:MAG: thiamine phosphate synthase [Pseudomonadota bacterium]
MGLKHQAASARKWRAAIRRIETHLPEYLPPIFFLTDPERVPDPIHAIRNLPRGSGVIYRHFGAENRLTVGADLQRVCSEMDHKFLVSADPQLALTINADGVHWPEVKLPSTRQWHGRFRLQTASAHSGRAIRRAAQAGMDAVLFSAIFPSASPSAGSPLGAARLRFHKAQAKIPIYALGGLNARNAGRISGVSGGAGIEGLMSS